MITSASDLPSEAAGATGSVAKRSGPVVPASFFGMPLGVLALGILWRAAADAWPVPPMIGESLIAVGAVLWFVVAVFWASKWLYARREAAAELEHPIQCCFVGLAGVTALLISIGATPHVRVLGIVFAIVGGVWVVAFSLWRTGRLWMGGRDHSATTPVLYLPSVAGGFVLASALGALGNPDAGQFAFCAALFSWLAIESVLLHRLYTLPEMPAPLRPTLGIQLAPPAVGAVAYLNVGGGQPDFVAHALIGYALMQMLILLRLWPWLRAAGPSLGWWAFSFGLAALPTAAAKLVAHGDHGVIAPLAAILTVVGTLAILAIAAMTLTLLARGKLLPK
jgi:tellurite resistance protein